MLQCGFLNITNIVGNKEKKKKLIQQKNML